MRAMKNSFVDSARAFLEEAAPAAPDFSRYTVLIPHYHARQPFLKALSAQLAASALGSALSLAFIPPRCQTLPDWVADLPVPRPVPESLRLSRLYEALRGHDWLPGGAARWALAQSMLELIEELDAANLHPPASAAEFATQLKVIERRYENTPLALEAALIFELWRADRGMDAGAQRAYAQQWAARIGQVDGPVFLLGLSGLSRLEEGALRQLAGRVPVIPLPVAPRFSERDRVLKEAWQPDQPAPSLRDRAQAVAQAFPDSPLGLADGRADQCQSRHSGAGRNPVLSTTWTPAWPSSWNGVVRDGVTNNGVTNESGIPLQPGIALYPATDLEDEARVAANWVRDRLAEGATHIGIVALDRLAARRLRALLERDGILLQDETGWSFPTTVVSHVVDRWQTLLSAGFYYRDVLDFLASPHCLNDLSEAERRSVLASLRALYARTHVVQGLDALLRFSEEEPAVRAVLERLSTAARLFDDRAHPLADWQARLDKMFDGMGISPALETDSAGRCLRQLLKDLTTAVVADGTRYRRSEWAAWLALGLEAATFQEGDIRSPLRLTHLAAARLRDFDALLVLGADARHLPGEASAGLLADTVRRELGLPGRGEHEQRMEAALRDILSRSTQALLTWQDQIDGEANGTASCIRLLETVHQLAWGRGLNIAPPRYTTPVPDDLPAAQAPAMATLPSLPERLSASAWQGLIHCPYQYFARYGLRLNALDEVAEEMEKKDYGTCVHGVLAEFHAAHPTLSRADRDSLLDELKAISRRVFAVWARRDLLAEAWRTRWEAVLPAYLDWALAHSEKGYRCVETEQPRSQPSRSQPYSRTLTLPEGQALELYGYIDRCDLGAGGRLVIDYKTQAESVLRKWVQPDQEAVQLPFYGILTGAAEASFVGVDDPGQVKRYSAQAPLAEAAAAELERIQTVFAAIASGQTLPANGLDVRCEHCEAHGICRKGDWIAPGQALD